MTAFFHVASHGEAEIGCLAPESASNAKVLPPASPTDSRRAGTAREAVIPTRMLPFRSTRDARHRVLALVALALLTACNQSDTGRTQADSRLSADGEYRAAPDSGQAVDSASLELSGQTGTATSLESGSGEANSRSEAATHSPAAPPVGSLLKDGSVRPPNELGRVMVLEYHLIGEEGRWTRDPERFAQDLQLLYERGYRPVSAAELMDASFNLPAGLSPVVITFDDASPSQFRYIETSDGKLEIDPASAVGVWLEFGRTRPDWRNRAVFCMLPAAEAGRAFFGNRGIEGQKTEWRFLKVKFLHEQGFELCNHTLWHANLGKYDDAFVQEQIARGVLAIDSVVPGYRVRTFALPLGVWPRNRELAYRGSWTDPKTGRVVSYDFDAVLEVAGGPTRGPHDSQFERPGRLNRVQVYGDELERTLDRMDRGLRYVSDGNPNVVTPAVSNVATGG